VREAFPLNPAPSIMAALFLWTVVAIVAATTSFIGLGGSTLGEWVTIAGYMLAFFYSWIPISFSIYWLVSRFAEKELRWTAQLLIHAGYLTAITVLLAILVHPFTWQTWLYGDKAVGYHALNSFIYSTIVICSMMINYYRVVRSREAAAHAAERRQAALERALDRSRMEALRAQVNPHFLFNTLNSIASLVASSSNREAYTVVELLASLLRYALDVSRDSVVTLDDELRFLDAYVEIEKIRYGPRLRFTKSVPANCMESLVPTLSLQPLVENAIKHAVAVSTRPVAIDVRVVCQPQVLCIAVSDDGPGLKAPISLGVGLSNVRDRLNYLYSGEAKFAIVNNEQGGVTVTMQVPDKRSTLRSAEDGNRSDLLLSKPGHVPLRPRECVE